MPGVLAIQGVLEWVIQTLDKQTICNVRSIWICEHDHSIHKLYMYKQDPDTN